MRVPLRLTHRVVPSSQSQDKYEAAMSGAVNSGYVQQSLGGDMAGATVSNVNTVQAQRAGRIMRGKGGRSNRPPAAPRPPAKPPARPRSPPPGKKGNKPNKKPNGRRSAI